MAPSFRCYCVYTGANTESQHTQNDKLLYCSAKYVVVQATIYREPSNLCYHFYFSMFSYVGQSSTSSLYLILVLCMLDPFSAVNNS